MLGDLDFLQEKLQSLLKCRSAIQNLKILFPQNELCAAQTKDSSQVQKSTIKKVYECSHPYVSNMDTTEICKFPGASKIVLTFDSRCRTEEGADWLAICEVNGNSAGKEIIRCTGRPGRGRNCTWPGVNSPSLTLPRGMTQFALRFFSDYSCEEWGYRFTVVATIENETIMPSVKFHWCYVLHQKTMELLLFLVENLSIGDLLQKDLESRTVSLLENPLVHEKISMLAVGYVSKSGLDDSILWGLIHERNEPAWRKLLSHMQKFVSPVLQSSQIEVINIAVYSCIAALIKASALEEELVKMYMSCERNLESKTSCNMPSKLFINMWKMGQQTRDAFKNISGVKKLENGESDLDSLDSRDKEMARISSGIVENATFLLLTRGDLGQTPLYGDKDRHQFDLQTALYDADESSLDSAVRLLRNVSPGQNRQPSSLEEHKNIDGELKEFEKPTLKHSSSAYGARDARTPESIALNYSSNSSLSLFTTDCDPDTTISAPKSLPSLQRASSEGGSSVVSTSEIHPNSHSSAMNVHAKALPAAKRPGLYRSSSTKLSSVSLNDNNNHSKVMPLSADVVLPSKLGSEGSQSSINSNSPRLIYSATSAVAAAARLRSMIAYRNKQKYRNSRKIKKDDLETSRVKATMEFVLQGTAIDLNNQKDKINSTETNSKNNVDEIAKTSVMSDLRKVHALHNRRSKSRLIGISAYVEILRDCNSLVSGDSESDTHIYSRHRTTVTSIIESFADILRRIQSDACAFNEISQELHICTGVAGCNPEKDRQIRLVFSTIYRLIVDFAIKIYSLFEEANVGKVEAGTSEEDDLKSCVMECLRALSFDFQSPDFSMLINSLLIDRLLPRLLQSFDRDVRLSAEQLLSLLIQRSSTQSGFALNGDDGVGLGEKMLKLLIKSLENICNESQHVSRLLVNENYDTDDGLKGINLLPRVVLLNGESIGLSGYTHPHIEVGLKHSFSIWIKRPCSINGILEAFINDECPQMGRIVVGSFVMRSNSASWDDLSDSDGGLGNIGIVTSIMIVSTKDSSKKKPESATIQHDPKDIIYVRWGLNSASNAGPTLIRSHGKYYRSQLTLACPSVGGHIYSKGSISSQSKSIAHCNKLLPPWSVFGMCLLPDASVNVFISKICKPAKVKMESDCDTIYCPNGEGNSEDFYNMRSKIQVPADKWVHLAVSVNQSKVSLYMDGRDVSCRAETQKITKRDGENASINAHELSGIRESEKDPSFNEIEDKKESKGFEDSHFHGFTLPNSLLSVKSSTFSDVIIIESPHNYCDNTDFYEEIIFKDDVEEVEVIFDNRSVLENRADYIKFLKDDKKTTWHSASMFTGGNGTSRNFPGTTKESPKNDENGEESGMDSRSSTRNAPLIIKSNRFWFHFYSDSSSNYWGYKIFLRAKKYKKLSEEGLEKSEISKVENLNDGPFYIGQRPFQSGCNSINTSNSVNAMIADLRLFNRALSQKEVSTIAENGSKTFANDDFKQLSVNNYLSETHTLQVLMNLNIAIQLSIHESQDDTLGRSSIPFNASHIISILFRFINSNRVWDPSPALQSLCVDMVILLLPYSGIEIMQTIDGKSIDTYLQSLLKDAGSYFSTATKSGCTPVDKASLAASKLRLAHSIVASSQSSGVQALVDNLNSIKAEGFHSEFNDLSSGLLCFLGGDIIHEFTIGSKALYSREGSLQEEVVVLGPTFVPTNCLRKWSDQFGQSGAEGFMARASEDKRNEYMAMWEKKSHFGEAMVISSFKDSKHSICVVPRSKLRKFDSLEIQRTTRNTSIYRDVIARIGESELISLYTTILSCEPRSAGMYYLKVLAAKSLHKLFGECLISHITVEDALSRALLKNAFAPYQSELDLTIDKEKKNAATLKASLVHKDTDSDWDTDDEHPSSLQIRGIKTLAKNEVAKENRRRELKSIIIESEHPYKDNTSIKVPVCIVGAKSLVVVFDRNCATERHADWVGFFSDPDCNEKLHQNTFSGGLRRGGGGNFPGTNGVPPFVVRGSKFYYHFFSDGSVNGWGWKATVYASCSPDGRDVLDRIDRMKQNVKNREMLYDLYHNDTAITSGIITLDGSINEKTSNINLVSACLEHINNFISEGPRSQGLRSRETVGSDSIDTKEYGSIFIDTDLESASVDRAMTEVISERDDSYTNAAFMTNIDWRNAVDVSTWYNNHLLRCSVLCKSAKRNAKEKRSELEVAQSTANNKNYASPFLCKNNNGDLDFTNGNDIDSSKSSPLYWNTTDSIDPKDILSPWEPNDSKSNHLSYLNDTFVGLSKVLIRQYSLRILGITTESRQQNKQRIDSNLLLSLVNEELEHYDDSETEKHIYQGENNKRMSNTLRLILHAAIESGEEESTALQGILRYLSDFLRVKSAKSENNEIAPVNAEPVVVESEHPYQANHTQTWTVCIPEAEWLCVAFDSNCQTRLPEKRTHEITQSENHVASSSSGKDSTEQSVEDNSSEVENTEASKPTNDPKNENENNGAYVTVETGLVKSAAANSVRFCGAQWPLPPQSQGKMYECVSPDGSQVRSRNQIMLGSYLRVEGDTLTITLTSQDNRPSLWGFRCYVYGLHSESTETADAAAISYQRLINENSLSRNSVQQKLACWAINTLLEQGGVHADNTILKQLSDHIFTIDAVSFLRNVILSSFESGSNSSDAAEFDLDAQQFVNRNYQQMRDRKAALSTFNMGVQAFNSMIKMLPMVKDSKDAPTMEAFLAELQMVRQEILRKVSIMRIVEHDHILKTCTQISEVKTDSWMKRGGKERPSIPDNTVVYATTYSSGIANPRQIKCRLIREVVAEELFEVEFDGGISDTENSSSEVPGDMSTGNETLKEEMGVVQNRDEGRGSRMKEGMACNVNYRGRGRWYPGNITCVNENGTVNILYHDGEKESMVEENMVRLVGAPEREKEPEPEDLRYDVNNYYTEESIDGLRFTGLRRELVLRKDIQVTAKDHYKKAEPLQDHLDIDDNLVPFCVNSQKPQSYIDVRKTCTIQGKISYLHPPYRSIYKALDKIESFVPFAYSERVQELAEVLTLMDAGLRSAKGEDSIDGAPEWLQLVRKSVELMHIVRTNAIPDSIMNTIYLPLVSSVMRKCYTFTSQEVIHQEKSVSIQGAKSLLILFNRSKLSIHKVEQGQTIEVKADSNSSVVEDSASLCAQRHLAIRTFFERNDSQFEGIGNDIIASTCEVDGDTCTIRLSSILPEGSPLHCVVVPAYHLPEALKLARSPLKSDIHSQTQANILRRHVENLDALYGSNLNKTDTAHESTRACDTALMAHVSARQEIDKLKTAWVDLVPSEEELKRSVLLKKLSDVSVKEGAIGNYCTWNAYHPVLAFRSLVLSTSFYESLQVDSDAENIISTSASPEHEKDVKCIEEPSEGRNVSDEADLPSTTVEDDDDDDKESSNGGNDDTKGIDSASLATGRLPGINSTSLYRCNKGSLMTYMEETPSAYSGHVLCDDCGHRFHPSPSRKDPIWHCNCGCETDFCTVCAMNRFGDLQARSEESPKVAQRKNGNLYEDLVLDILFPNAAAFLPYIDSKVSPNTGDAIEANVGEVDNAIGDSADLESTPEGDKLVIETDLNEKQTDSRFSQYNSTGIEDISKEMLDLLRIRCGSAMSVRFHLIEAMNACVIRCLALINISKVAADTEHKPASAISILLGQCSSLLLGSTRDVMWRSALQATYSRNSSGSFGELKVSRSLAKKHALYELVLMGEYSQDAGGPYRESFDIYMAELQSDRMTLLILSPNGTHKTGLNRESWVFNPAATSNTELELFAFFGKLLGIAIRSKGYLNLNLAPMMWKLICGQSATVEDLEGVDYGVVKNVLEAFRFIDQGEHAIDAETFAVTFFETFTTIATDGRSVPLCVGGESIDVTFANRSYWCDLVEEYRLHEFDKQAKAVRKGLATIVPLDLLSLFPWQSVEMMVCGKAEIDVDLLKQCTTYDGCNESDEHVHFFWEVLNSFNTEERQALVKFTWGRSRLPLTADDFPEKFTISTFNQSPADQYYPVAHTCFFSLELPRYTSKKIMRRKLLYAIFNCLEIDGDETGPGAEAAAFGMEEEF
eukprot:GSChrysophyteH1.ASY1.ANO1.1134.1 assembled CDS